MRAIPLTCWTHAVITAAPTVSVVPVSVITMAAASTLRIPRPCDFRRACIVLAPDPRSGAPRGIPPSNAGMHPRSGRAPLHTGARPVHEEMCVTGRSGPDGEGFGQIVCAKLDQLTH